MTATASEPLPLSAQELLRTTRAVRKRLDFDRPVSRELITTCVRDALQAPSGSNRWPLQFIAVDDPNVRRRLGEIYREAYATYKSADGVYIGSIEKGSAVRNRQQQRTAGSADYLGEHIGDAPALVVGAVHGRTNSLTRLATLLGSGIPGMWSFMLSARLRGLGTSWTTVHLLKEAEFNEALGIPGDRITTFCMTPVAYTKGTDFKPALRPDPDEVLHWNRWTDRS